MENLNRLCMNCMGQLDEHGVCRSCKLAAVPANDPARLPQHTVLDDRYYIGRTLSANGESTVYLGYDAQKGVTVEVREFFPTNMCCRIGYEVAPLQGMEIQYKAFLSDFTDLHRALGRLTGIPILVPVEDMFEANGTVYVISRPFSGIHFGDFLNINVGELTWEQTRGFLFPLLISLQHLHENNILHRAISPDTLLISRSGELKLVDFCLAPARTLKSELDAELYNGYAAPEQYLPTGWQGSWTDVYAVAAVMYKSLTGTMPSSAANRANGETLFAVSDLNPSVPREVSEILDQALAFDPNERIKSISDLQARLSYAQDGGEKSGDTRRVVSREEVRRAEQEQEEEEARERYERYVNFQRRRRKKRPHYGLLSGLIATVVMCGAVVYILYGMYQDKLETQAVSASSYVSVSESEYLGSMIVPKFVGENINDVNKDSRLKGKVTFSIIYEASADYAEDIIFEQSPKQGESVEIGSVINVKVSKGIQNVTMPQVVGKPQLDAIQLLEAAQIDYEIIPVYVDGFDKGEVTRANYNAGDQITLSRDIVFLFVNQQERVESKPADESFFDPDTGFDFHG